MRRLLELIAVLLFASIAQAQESYTLSATAPQVAVLRAYVITQGRDVCLRLGLSASCNQAQACTTANAPGGAGCSPAQARGASVRIYPDSQAGREEFVTFVWVAPDFIAVVAATKDADRRYWCGVWWATIANQTQKDTACTNAGLASGCDVCP
jgi:hypothetical protein